MQPAARRVGVQAAERTERERAAKTTQAKDGENVRACVAKRQLAVRV